MTERYGRWEVVTQGGSKSKLSCKCDCGTLREVDSWALRHGRTKSCGCLRKETNEARDLKNRKERIFPGKIFHWLTVLKDLGVDNKVSCVCKCGEEVVVAAGNLCSGHTKSCGCLVAQRTREASMTHGLSNSDIYNTWKGMLSRCNNPNNPRYMDYGGRGIGVCGAWEGVHEFKLWAESHGYKKGLQIDREDNEKDYEPGNCHFISNLLNSHNTRLLRKSNSSGFRGAGRDGKGWVARVDSCLGPLLRKSGFRSAKAAAFARDLHCIKHSIPLPLNFPELALQGPL